MTARIDRTRKLYDRSDAGTIEMLAGITLRRVAGDVRPDLPSRAFTAVPAVGATLPAARGLVVLVVVMGLTPLAVLLAFVLRVAMISKQTIAITPFTMAQQESEDERS